MKLAVLSDTHIHSFEHISPRITAALPGVDLIVHAGDFISIDVYSSLCKMGDVKAVRGNMDDDELRKLLPQTELFEVMGKKIGLIHGWGSQWGLAEKIRSYFGDVELIIYGNTHVPHNEKIGDVHFFNPETAKESFGILEIETEIKGRIIIL